MAATILVVEDEQLMRELLRLHLSAAGYRVLLAEDPVAAGQVVVKQRPDLILADVEMPFMTGIEFVQALRSDPAVAAIPVIFVSSRSDLEGLCRQLGAVAFLEKPVLSERLLSTVDKAIRFA
jgi:two-component system chemotaxis response regulator CheY